MKTLIWLLTRLGIDDALIGDLLEQRDAGRSRAWYFRQIVSAIVSTFARELAVHPFRATLTVLAALLLRSFIVRVVGPYEASIDSRIIGTLLWVASPLGPYAWIVALSLANSIVLAPVWFLTGFVLVRFSRVAVPVFVALAVAILLPHMTRQLHSALASDVVRWLLPLQLTIFATSIGAFAFSTLIGATVGLTEPNEIA